MANEPEKVISSAELEDDFIRCFREELAPRFRPRIHDEEAQKEMEKRLVLVEDATGAT